MRVVQIKLLALVVCIVAALCAALPAQARPPQTTAEKIERAAARGAIDKVEKALNGLRSYAAPSRVPSDLRGERNHLSKEFSMLILQAQRLASAMTMDQQREVAHYASRPNLADNSDDDVPPGDSNGLCESWVGQVEKTYVSPSSRFRLHWIETSQDAPPMLDTSPANGIPDYVETVAITLDSVYQAQVSSMQWNAPPADAIDGPELDVFFCETLSTNSVYGYVVNDLPPINRIASSYMVLDDDFSHLAYPDWTDPMKVTAAHEFNHMIQYGYDFLQDIWMMEATATWMEEQVYPTINDYVNYLPNWAANPGTPLTTANGSREYGSAVWNLWLSEVEGWGQQVVLTAWEKSQANSVGGRGFAPDAYSDAINDFFSSGSFSESFGRFAVGLAEWRNESPLRFADAASYPDITRLTTASIGSTLQVGLNHTTFQHLNLAAPSSGPIRVRVSSGDTTAPIASSLAAIVGRRPSGEVVSQQAAIPIGGPATLQLDNAAEFSRITAVIVNRDVSHSGWNGVNDWSWSNDAILYSVQVDAGNQSPTASFTLSGPVTSATPVTLTATSTDPDSGASLEHSWDLDNDGAFDDATGASISHAFPYPATGQQIARLRSVDEFGASGEYSLTFPVEKGPDVAKPKIIDLAPVVRANLSKLPRVKKARMRLRFRPSEDVRLKGVIKYRRRTIAKASAKGKAGKKSVISFKFSKKYWRLLKKRKKLKIAVTLTALDSTNQKFSDKRKTLIRKG